MEAGQHEAVGEDRREAVGQIWVGEAFPVAALAEVVSPVAESLEDDTQKNSSNYVVLFFIIELLLF